MRKKRQAKYAKSFLHDGVEYAFRPQWKSSDSLSTVINQVSDFDIGDLRPQEVASLFQVCGEASKMDRRAHNIPTLNECAFVAIEKLKSNEEGFGQKYSQKKKKLMETSARLLLGITRLKSHLQGPKGPVHKSSVLELMDLIANHADQASPQDIRQIAYCIRKYAITEDNRKHIPTYNNVMDKIALAISSQPLYTIEQVQEKGKKDTRDLRNPLNYNSTTLTDVLRYSSMYAQHYTKQSRATVEALELLIFDIVTFQLRASESEVEFFQKADFNLFPELLQFYCCTVPVLFSPSKERTNRSKIIFQISASLLLMTKTNIFWTKLDPFVPYFHAVALQSEPIKIPYLQGETKQSASLEELELLLLKSAGLTKIPPDNRRKTVMLIKHASNFTTIDPTSIILLARRICFEGKTKHLAVNFHLGASIVCDQLVATVSMLQKFQSPTSYSTLVSAKKKFSPQFLSKVFPNEKFHHAKHLDSYNYTDIDQSAIDQFLRKTINALKTILRHVIKKPLQKEAISTATVLLHSSVDLIDLVPELKDLFTKLRILICDQSSFAFHTSIFQKAFDLLYKISVHYPKNEGLRLPALPFLRPTDNYNASDHRLMRVLCDALCQHSSDSGVSNGFFFGARPSSIQTVLSVIEHFGFTHDGLLSQNQVALETRLNQALDGDSIEDAKRLISITFTTYLLDISNLNKPKLKMMLEKTTDLYHTFIKHPEEHLECAIEYFWFSIAGNHHLNVISGKKSKDLKQIKEFYNILKNSLANLPKFKNPKTHLALHDLLILVSQDESLELSVDFQNLIIEVNENLYSRTEVAPFLLYPEQDQKYSISSLSNNVQLYSGEVINNPNQIYQALEFSLFGKYQQAFFSKDYQWTEPAKVPDVYLASDAYMPEEKRTFRIASKGVDFYQKLEVQESKTIAELQIEQGEGKSNYYLQNQIVSSGWYTFRSMMLTDAGLKETVVTQDMFFQQEKEDLVQMLE